MTPEQWQQLKDLYAAAEDRPSHDCVTLLRKLNADDPERCAQLKALLAHRAPTDDFLEQSVTRAVLPSVIGRYRILRRLGEGGMGVVYEAEQQQPRRRVALKVIRSGLAGPELLRRFEQESQVLGRLQNPGIAQIYEAGTAETGFGSQPYFAMELIQGESLLQYAESHQLSTRQRLALMAEVCEAVNYAHQRGIIHRDLKPANILVEASGHPKILDFGVARVIDNDAQAIYQTDVGQLMGTLAYMSPEQTLANPIELDTRSDVYTLGVILFELLAGCLPYAISPQLHEAVRTIREEDPMLLRSINRTYRGDVETIVGRALEKQKDRRYASAADLAADINRHLKDEPIAARPPSAIYHLHKFTRRHKPLVAGITAVFIALIAGIVTSAWEATRAWRAEHVATTERDRAISERKRADSEAAAANAINDFLQNDVLAQASPNTQAGPNTKPARDLAVRTALDRAAARITGKFAAQPLIEASIRQTIGNTYRDLGLYLEAQKQLERAVDLRGRLLGRDHRDTLSATNSLAELYRMQGRYVQAELLLTKVLDARRHLFGEQHPSTLTSMHDLALLYYSQGKYAQAELLYPRILKLKRRVLGEDHPDTLNAMDNLAGLYLAEGKYTPAEPLYARVLEIKRRVLGEEHPDTLSTMNNLAVLYKRQGNYSQAVPLFVKVLDIERRILGEEHPETLIGMSNLAVLQQAQGRYAQAEVLFTRISEIRHRVLGPEHPSTLLSMSNLAAFFLKQGRYTEAEPLLTKVLALRHRILGPEHPDTLDTQYNLARLYLGRSAFAQAEPLLMKVLSLQQRLLGEEHPDTLATMSGLGLLYEKRGKHGEAEQLYAKVLQVRRRTLGAEHPETTRILVSMGKICLERKKYAQAESLLREALHAQEKRNPDTWDRYEAQSALGSTLASQARFAEAEPLLVAGYQGLIRRQATIPWENQVALKRAGECIVQLYRAWGKPEKIAHSREGTLAATASDPPVRM